MNISQRIEQQFKGIYRDWEVAAKSGDPLGSRQVLIDNLTGETKQFIREVLYRVLPREIDFNSPGVKKYYRNGRQDEAQSGLGYNEAIGEMERSIEELGL